MRADDAVVEILKREGVTTLSASHHVGDRDRGGGWVENPLSAAEERVGVDMADGYAG